MPIPYERRKEYFKHYRDTHKEQINEYVKRYNHKKLQKNIETLQEVLGNKLNTDNVVSRPTR